jgi:hypothetical protein
VANNPPFSRAGLEAAELLGAVQMLKSDGTVISVDFDSIVTPNVPEIVNKVKEFLNSTASPSFSNSGVTNVYQAKYNHIVLPKFASTSTGARDSAKETWWMLVSVKHTDAILEISEQPHVVAPSPGANSEDFDNDDWKYKTNASYGIEILDPKFVVLSTGDLTA